MNKLSLLLVAFCVVNSVLCTKSHLRNFIKSNEINEKSVAFILQVCQKTTFTSTDDEDQNNHRIFLDTVSTRCKPLPNTKAEHPDKQLNWIRLTKQCVSELRQFPSIKDQYKKTLDCARDQINIDKELNQLLNGDHASHQNNFYQQRITNKDKQFFITKRTRHSRDNNTFRIKAQQKK